MSPYFTSWCDASLAFFKLQSRIRHLERERMEQHDEIDDGREHQSTWKRHQSMVCFILISHVIDKVHASTIQLSMRTSRPSTPVSQSLNVDPHSASHHHRFGSFPVATSATAQRALAYATLRSKPTPTPQLALPPSTPRVKLVPKRNARPVASETMLSPLSELSPSSCDSRREPQHESVTPTRRGLQAFYAKTSLDNKPPSSPRNDDNPSSHTMNDQGQPVCIPNPRDRHGRDPEAKRTAFKLDSIVLTSKFFPLPSSRSKTPLVPVSSDHRTDSHLAVFPLSPPTPIAASHVGSVFLSNPSNKNVKVKLPQKARKSLSHSLGLEENRHPDVLPRGDDHKIDSRSRGHVTFPERLFSSSSDRGDVIEAATEPVASRWSSWGRKKRPPPSLSPNSEKQIPLVPSTPPAALSSRFAKSQGGDSGESQERGFRKRSSFAPGCLKSLVPGSGERDKAHPDEHRMLRRSLSDTHPDRSRSHSRSKKSHSAAASPDHSIGAWNLNTRSKDEKARITPSRVGTPMPKGRSPDLRAEDDLERTNSLRSAGRWGQRGRGFAKELTRRRTIHPMFSFEKLGSAGVSTASSLRDGEKADNEETRDKHRGAIDWTKVEKLPRRTRPPGGMGPDRAGPPVLESGISHSHASQGQDESLSSGHNGGSAGLMRSESGSSHKRTMMRTRLGVQTHGTFAFEPAAAAVIPPRSIPPGGADRSFIRSEESRGGPLSRTNAAVIRAKGLIDRRENSTSERPEQYAAVHNKQAKDREYLEYCEDLKAVLGDGEEWSSFKKCKLSL